MMGGDGMMGSGMMWGMGIAHLAAVTGNRVGCGRAH